MGASASGTGVAPGPDRAKAARAEAPAIHPGPASSAVLPNASAMPGPSSPSRRRSGDAPTDRRACGLPDRTAVSVESCGRRAWLPAIRPRVGWPTEEGDATPAVGRNVRSNIVNLASTARRTAALRRRLRPREARVGRYVSCKFGLQGRGADRRWRSPSQFDETALGMPSTARQSGPAGATHPPGRGCR
jgi:hypothetical protein